MTNSIEICLVIFGHLLSLMSQEVKKNNKVSNLDIIATS